MIRDVVIHMNSEQPLMADLTAMPTASDACLVCTNLRYLDGKKPTFIERVDSWFLIPLGIVRFVEVPQGTAEPELGVIALHAPMIRDESMEPDPELDAELLRRVLEA